MSLKDDLKEVPSWVWLGGAAAVGLLWVLGRARGGQTTSSGTGGTATLVGATTSPTDTTANTTTTLPTQAGYSASDLAALQSQVYQYEITTQAQIAALQPTPAPTQTQSTPLPSTGLVPHTP